VSGYYSVIQYTPNPIIDERINFGVVTFGDGRVRFRFLKNWSRVKQFGANVTSLKAFAHKAAQNMTEAMVREASAWINSIQFTKPAASLLDPDALIEDMAKRFLVDPQPAGRQGRTRRDAVTLARRKLGEALSERVGKATAKTLIKSHYPVEGKLDKHEFDLSVANGKPFFSVQGLSFEAEGPEAIDRLVKDVRSTAFSVEDVRHRNSTFPVGIVALPPKGSSAVYDMAKRTFQEVGADLVEESNVDGWAAYRVEEAAM
jgi:Protein of unknown function (DUF3037)